jgi:hypothetical protein
VFTILLSLYSFKFVSKACERTNTKTICYF